jgi:hypothetical protein
MSKRLFSFLFIALFAVYSVNSLRLTASPQPANNSTSNLPACTEPKAKRDHCTETRNSYGPHKCRVERDCKSTKTCSKWGWCVRVDQIPRQATQQQHGNQQHGNQQQGNQQHRQQQHGNQQHGNQQQGNQQHRNQQTGNQQQNQPKRG